jgi:hypothetical protein
VFVTDGYGAVHVFGRNTNSTMISGSAAAWWRNEETHNACLGAVSVVTDSAGSNDGMITGPFPPPKTCEGAVGRGIRLDPNGGEITVPDSTTLKFGTGSFSIEGWVQMDSTAGLYSVLDKRLNEGRGYHVYVYQGGIGVQVNGGTAFQNWTNPNSSLGDGEWHYFAFVVDRGAATIRGYFDGVATATPLAATLAGLSTDNNASLLIGAHSGGFAHYGGAIDDLTLYSRALTPQEVNAIWLARYAGKNPRANVTPPSSRFLRGPQPRIP